MWCAVPSSALLWTGRGQAMHTRAACSHCMQERKSGFRFQNAEGQRHAAVVAERKLRPQMALVHPPGAAARKAVFRRAAFQPDGLYLTERKGACKAGAGRLRKASFAAKSAAALAAL